ncbi:hypothetical protein [Terrihabitans sp. B22-R8]|uniref:hypothetical protein n=1 Tax=Terrihabitans sp. B22-R8 TaxID=3425128 RepID=UPI00403CE0F4
MIEAGREADAAHVVEVEARADLLTYRPLNESEALAKAAYIDGSHSFEAQELASQLFVAMLIQRLCAAPALA